VFYEEKKMKVKGKDGLKCALKIYDLKQKYILPTFSQPG